MGKTSNYTKTVMESLSKLADKVDASGSGTGGKADFYDVVSNSLARISDNYSGSGSGGGGGTGGGVLVVNDNDGTLDKTWQEIADAFDNGSIIVHDYNSEKEGRFRSYLVEITNFMGVYAVKFRDFSENVDFTCATNSASGYPTYTE